MVERRKQHRTITYAPNGVRSNLCASIERKITKAWGKRNAKVMINLWNATQVREPYSVEELENLVLGVG